MADVCDSQQAQCRQALESVSVDLSDAIVLKASADGEQESGHGLSRLHVSQSLKRLLQCFESRTLTSNINLNQHSGLYRFNTHISWSRTQPSRVGISVILLYDRSLVEETRTNVNYSSK